MIADDSSWSTSVGGMALVPVVPKTTLAKKKPAGKKLTPAQQARALQLKLKAKAAASKKKNAAQLKKEQQNRAMKEKKAREAAKKKKQKEREQARKLKLKQQAAAKKQRAKIKADNKKARDIESKAQAKLKVAALQAKLQAKYWREVEKQAHTAAEKRKAENDKRKFKEMNRQARMRMLTNGPLALTNSQFNHAVPKKMQAEILALRAQVAQMHDANLMSAFGGRGGGARNKAALAMLTNF